jgi:5-methylcytosine-specific restriction endonuclease McrA
MSDAAKLVAIFPGLLSSTMNGQVVKKAPRCKMKQSVRCHIASRQGWTCNVCASMLPALWHVDHINPLTDGGGNEERNLQALCACCHRVKTSAEHRARSKKRRATKQVATGI